MDWLFGWLEDFVAWVWAALIEVFVALWELLYEFAVEVFGDILDAISAAVGAIPVPDFLSSGMGGLFAGLDSAVLWGVSSLGIPEGLAMLGVAVGVRLARKFVTLFQW